MIQNEQPLGSNKKSLERKFDGDHFFKNYQW
jgi:hypothetical protein